MPKIYIINKLRLSAKGLIMNSSKQLAHLRQGDLDGACAVYSMMMCLVIERIIKRNLITDVPTNLKRNTSNGRLVNFFLEKQGMVIDGYTLEKLQADINSAFKSKVQTHYNERKEENFFDDIINSLDNNHPVEILFLRKRGFGHVVVAIGYQRDNHKTQLFCLDPARPIEVCQIWNNILEIDFTSSSKYNCHNLWEDDNVSIEELLVFTPKF